ncbi:trypsin-like serine peptidase [Sorangium sp. So ce1099]|uniref:trypsin-like serine peptidase n=1 Tax=Sorangium sp. So ce1099 TaxID=3133331 RepID=UPI003F5F485D
MLTAGHCLFYDVFGARFASSIRIRDASGRKIGPITPRFNGLSTPRHPLNFFIERSWYDKLDDGASACDYGAILLEPQEIMTDGQHQQSTIPYTSVEDSELRGAQITIAGYPSTLPDESRPDPRWMCSDTKQVTSCDATLIFYKVGTRDGQSGSPICMNRGGQQLCGIGIHTGSADKVHRTDLGLNVGIRFTRELQQELSSLALAVESGSSDDWVNERWERGA